MSCASVGTKKNFHNIKIYGTTVKILCGMFRSTPLLCVNASFLIFRQRASSI